MLSFFLAFVFGPLVGSLLFAFLFALLALLLTLEPRRAAVYLLRLFLTVLDDRRGNFRMARGMRAVQRCGRSTAATLRALGWPGASPRPSRASIFFRCDFHPWEIEHLLVTAHEQLTY